MMNHASSEESWIAFDFWKKMKLLTTSSQVSEILLSLYLYHTSSSYACLKEK